MKLSVQRHTVNELHGDVVYNTLAGRRRRTAVTPIVGLHLADFVDSDDVWVIQRRCRLGLLNEPPHAVGVFNQVGGQKLQGDGAAQSRVFCFVDFAHAARAKQGDNLIVP